MKIGEVSLLTNDVIKLADFYKFLLGVDNGSNDPVHQTIITTGTQLTVFNDGSVKNNRNENICLAFTVDNINTEYERLTAAGAAGVEFIEKPTARPWGAINMSLRDPDGNVIYMRQFIKN